jgi:5-methylcytosine-specific restriction endonuclease McrA
MKKTAQYFHYEIIEEFTLSKLEEYKDHRRMKVFHQKGTKCVKCDVIGTKVGLGKDQSGNLHIDVYTEDLYPLTIDHIIPKSLGGSDNIENLQPMCCLCNWEKGNVLVKNTGNFKQYPSGSNVNKWVKRFKSVKSVKLGDQAYKITGRKRNKLAYLGIVTEITINPHTGREAVVTDLKPNSFFHINLLKAPITI